MSHLRHPTDNSSGQRGVMKRAGWRSRPRSGITCGIYGLPKRVWPCTRGAVVLSGCGETSHHMQQLMTCRRAEGGCAEGGVGEQPELLHQAVAAGNVDAVHALIKQGVWLDLPDHDGCVLEPGQRFKPTSRHHARGSHSAVAERLPGLLIAPQHPKTLTLFHVVSAYPCQRKSLFHGACGSISLAPVRTLGAGTPHSPTPPWRGTRPWCECCWTQGRTCTARTWEACGPSITPRA